MFTNEIVYQLKLEGASPVYQALRGAVFSGFSWAFMSCFKGSDSSDIRLDKANEVQSNKDLLDMLHEKLAENIVDVSKEILEQLNLFKTGVEYEKYEVIIDQISEVAQHFDVTDQETVLASLKKFFDDHVLIDEQYNLADYKNHLDQARQIETILTLHNEMNTLSQSSGDKAEKKKKQRNRLLGHLNTTMGKDHETLKALKKNLKDYPRIDFRKVINYFQPSLKVLNKQECNALSDEMSNTFEEAKNHVGKYNKWKILKKRGNELVGLRIDNSEKGLDLEMILEQLPEKLKEITELTSKKEGGKAPAIVHVRTTKTSMNVKQSRALDTPAHLDGKKGYVFTIPLVKSKQPPNTTLVAKAGEVGIEMGPRVFSFRSKDGTFDMVPTKIGELCLTLTSTGIHKSPEDDGNRLFLFIDYD